MSEFENLWNVEELLDQFEKVQTENEEMLLEKQKLESVVHKQSNEIARQAAKIKSLNERIGMLSESDVQLQKAQELRRRTEEQSRIATAAIEEAGMTVRRYEKKIKEADKKKSEAEQLIANTKTEIDKAAEKKIARYKSELKDQSKEKIKYYADEYHKQYMKYKTAMFALMIYCLIATFMEIITTDSCIHHFDMFASNISSIMDGFANVFDEIFSPLNALGVWKTIIEVLGRVVELFIVLAFFALVAIGAPYYAGKFYYKTVLKAESEIFKNIGIIIAEVSFVLLIWRCKYFPGDMRISMVWIWIIIQLGVAGAIKIYRYH